MTKFLLILPAASAAFAANDPWARVKDLKSGTEPRIYKKGIAQPILAKSDEVTEDNLIVVVRNEQIAIAKDLVDRIDYRPNKDSHITTETKSRQTDPDPIPGPPGHVSAVPGTSTSTSLGVGSKPGFELIYKRPAAPPRKRDLRVFGWSTFGQMAGYAFPLPSAPKGGRNAGTITSL